MKINSRASISLTLSWAVGFVVIFFIMLFFVILSGYYSGESNKKNIYFARGLTDDLDASRQLIFILESQIEGSDQTIRELLVEYAQGKDSFEKEGKERLLINNLKRIMEKEQIGKVLQVSEGTELSFFSFSPSSNIDSELGSAKIFIFSKGIKLNVFLEPKFK